MQDFNSLFPHFLERCVELKSALMPVAFLLLVVGVISSTLTGRRSAGAYVRTFGRTTVYIMLLVYLVTWGNELTALTDRVVKEVIRADPATVFEQYNAALIAEKSESENASWWDKLFNAGTTVFEAIVSGFLWLFGLMASLFLFLAYIVQKMVLYIGYSLSPIFIGFMAVRSLSHIGHKYLLSLVGIMVWPLGWAVAAIVSDGLMVFMADQSFLQGGGRLGGPIGYGLQGLIGLALLGVWLIFSTIAAPVIIQNAIATGYQAGQALLSGGTSAGASALNSGVTTAAAMASRGGHPAATLGLVTAASGTAAGAALVSAASGSHSGGLIGSLTMLNERQAARRKGDSDAPEFPKDDRTGSKTARAMIEQQRNGN